jgi:hypothetical protein
LIRSPSLFVSNPCLTSLNSACISFTPNQVCSLVRINHRGLLVHLWASTLHCVGPPSSHDVLISHITSCIHLNPLSKRISSLITPMIDAVWKFLPRWRMLPLTLEYEKVLFPFRAPARVVEPRGSSNEVCYNQSQEAQSDSTRCYVTHARKEKWHGWSRSLPPYKRPIVLLAMQSMHLSSFLMPSFINLGMRFLLRGRVVIPHVTETLIKSLNLQLCHKVRENQVVKVWNQKSRSSNLKLKFC